METLSLFCLQMVWTMIWKYIISLELIIIITIFLYVRTNFFCHKTCVKQQNTPDINSGSIRKFFRFSSKPNNPGSHIIIVLVKRHESNKNFRIKCLFGYIIKFVDFSRNGLFLAIRLYVNGRFLWDDWSTDFINNKNLRSESHSQQKKNILFL